MSKQKGKKNVITTIGEACEQYELKNPRKYNYEHDAEQTKNYQSFKVCLAFTFAQEQENKPSLIVVF